MAVYTLEQAEELHKQALDAYTKALKRKSYSIGSRNGGNSLESQDIQALAAQVQYWEKKIEELKQMQNTRSPFSIGSGVCKK